MFKSKEDLKILRLWAKYFMTKNYDYMYVGLTNLETGSGFILRPGMIFHFVYRYDDIYYRVLTSGFNRSMTEEVFEDIFYSGQQIQV